MSIRKFTSYITIGLVAMAMVFLLLVLGAAIAIPLHDMLKGN